jgi:hypothetical protein
MLPTEARAQESAVASAQRLYDDGKFGEAAASLKQAIASGKVGSDELTQARELLARCQVKAGDTAGATTTFHEMLRRDPLYRPDPLRVPPDEMAAFDAAKQRYDAEQVRASQKIPASIGVTYGIGSGDNKDFGEYVAQGGGDDKYDNKPQFGITVRFPVAARWSLDLELQRFRATNEDSISGLGHGSYEIAALPLSVSAVYLLMDRPKWRANLFAGGGPLLQASSSDQFHFFTIPLKIADDKTGTYLHLGAEGEYHVWKRLSVNARALVRSAKAKNLFKDANFNQYGTGESIGNRDVDFSGFAATIGIRAYVGY